MTEIEMDQYIIDIKKLNKELDDKIAFLYARASSDLLYVQNEFARRMLIEKSPHLEPVREVNEEDERIPVMGVLDGIKTEDTKNFVEAPIETPEVVSSTDTVENVSEFIKDVENTPVDASINTIVENKEPENEIREEIPAGIPEHLSQDVSDLMEVLTEKMQNEVEEPEEEKPKKSSLLRRIMKR